MPRDKRALTRMMANEIPSSPSTLESKNTDFSKTAPDLPEFSNRNHLDGRVSASLWQDKISSQFEIASHTTYPPATMLQVTNILCTGDAAN
ncbi:hypothetical protein OnM2_016064 [Erysiphe neolycopersici]|uniref:Uncharacterized protein n=1 Tax=Erysiphe neolycopersici TaxID=212602 RepID=A0A420I4W8_9PEZI|nr:hypothetical protein OnM2_016064 [Erysiphe neolycopersici]